MDLVTGGTGIVGVHVLLELAVQGKQVRALHRKASDRDLVRRVFEHYGSESVINRIEWVEGDLLDVTSLAEALIGVRHVYHAAAMVSFDPRHAQMLHEANVQGTANVVNAALAAGVKRLCHVSSTAAIGWAAPGVERDETLPWGDEKDVSDYARSKYQAELEVQRGIAEGLDAVMVNPCVIIGPGAAHKSSMTLVERMQRPMRFFPPGSNTVVDARDVAACMVQLMERGPTGERYLLVGENVSYAQLFGALARSFGIAPPKYTAKSWMLGLAWRLERVRTAFFGGNPLVTRDTANSAITVRSYSNKKVIALLGYRFRTLAESVANVSAFTKGTTGR